MEAATIALTKLPPLRSIFDALPNPILVVDENNVICFANSAAEDFFQASSTMLARHKLPDELCLVDAIPRTKIGKVDRPTLQATALDGRPRQRWRR